MKHKKNILILIVAGLLSLGLASYNDSNRSGSNKSSSAGHAIMDYREAKSLFWDQVYPKGYTLYCRAKITQFRRDDINIEHVFPMAWVKNSLKCGTRNECRDSSPLFNQIEADMHNLYPSLAKLNYARQAYRFGVIKGEQRDFGNKCDFEISKRYRVAEPMPKVRGEVARAMFYMEDRYDQLFLYEKQADILLKWHESDPPSKEEKRRNDIIEKIQGNRNPYIDNPELINKRIQK